MAASCPAVRSRIRACLHCRSCAALISFLGVGALHGCASAPQPAIDASQMRTSVQLSARLLDASDEASAAFNRVVGNALLNGDPTRTVWSYMYSRAEATSYIRSLALGAEPGGALVDLYVYSQLSVWACENRVRAYPELPLTPCDSTFGVLREEVLQIAREYMTPEKLARVDLAIDQWKQAHPDQHVIGLIRLSDLADSSGTAPIVLAQVAPSMFSPVTEAAQQLQEARLLGYQALWLASRLPTTVGWQLDATIYGAMASEPATRALADLGSLSGGISQSHQVLAALAASNATLSSHAEALGGRVEELEQSVESLSIGLGSNLQGVSSSLGDLGTEVRELDGADELATRVVRQATWSGIALISLAAGSLALVLWLHRHHSRRSLPKSN